MTVTREQCLREYGQVAAEALLAVHRGTVAEAAQRAYTPTGPPLAELEQRIAAIRAEDIARSATPHTSAGPQQQGTGRRRTPA